MALILAAMGTLLLGTIGEIDALVTLSTQGISAGDQRDVLVAVGFLAAAAGGPAASLLIEYLFKTAAMPVIVTVAAARAYAPWLDEILGQLEKLGRLSILGERDGYDELYEEESYRADQNRQNGRRNRKETGSHEDES